MEGAALALYFAVKGAAYCGWCALGVARFRPESRRLPWALGLGTLRLLLGLGFGIVIFLASNLVVAGLSETGAYGPTLSLVLAYLAVYLPVRWIEWAIIEAILRPPARPVARFALGVDRNGRNWRLGGAALSCAADLPVMLALGGLPIGRFMC
jgi:hypothetical protein